MSEKSQAERSLRDHLLVEYTRLMADDQEALETLEAHALLSDAVAARATDLHLDPFPDHYRIRLRIDGIIVDVIEVTYDQGRRLVNQFKAMADLHPIPSVNCDEGSFVFSLDDTDLDLRVTSIPCVSGDKMAIRVLSPPESVQNIGALGIPVEGAQWIQRWMDATGGMFLVSGPTGSGKTTTLYALLHELKLSDNHVITLEEPVEYEIPGINQIQVDPLHELTFASGTQAMLRLDPDYVLIGEIRDTASAEAAISVATSGRSMMATLHSRDSVGTITSLRNLGLSDYEIAANLGLVASQRLVRKLCPECRIKGKPDDVARQWLQECGKEVPEEVWLPAGCAACNNLGFRGRIGIFEVWQLSEADYSRILRHEDEHSLRQALVDRGQSLMLDDGLVKAQNGDTTLRELLRAGVLLSGRHSGPEEGLRSGGR
ncbi:GspE/PulE family protein [Marinobacter orientalis]|uniref:Flp pilus assembly complex ATPase component TadA n=1 Tax=Marinobacter orientalis TaxID=1928859 RepID=A0A7Y0RCT5_9GAMM|nr:ATPase, T2SS/T4P/T4SS family [Marinobacter orientalis]NMT63843.1 Flp pilus assembly complex ATPase component TadA [Marinobacter orientalis]TGX49945.1 type II/IV secretion system protein [Marinobacter orientalis]